MMPFNLIQKRNLIMDKVTEKYLAKMLEGAENGLTQMDTAVEQVNTQLEQMDTQREEMLTAVKELKELLGLSEEEENPLVAENVD
jgi:uncharacterized protein YhaN